MNDASEIFIAKNLKDADTITIKTDADGHVFMERRLGDDLIEQVTYSQILNTVWYDLRLKEDGVLPLRHLTAHGVKIVVDQTDSNLIIKKQGT